MPQLRRVLILIDPEDPVTPRLLAEVRRASAGPKLQAKSSSLLIRLAAERRLPLPSHRKEWVAQGAPCSYGPDGRTVGLAAAHYVDKILKGAKPADPSVELPTKFE